MRNSVRFALSIGAAVLIAGCGGSQSPIGAPGAMPQSRAIPPARSIARRNAPASSSYQVLYSFAGGSDGADPAAALINVNGTFYGTTEKGGGTGCGGDGCGTVFSLTASGGEKVVHSFAGGSDGANPAAALINVNGTLYGTTEYGGGSGCEKKLGCGTVFSLTASGAEKVLHSFTAPPDGAYPAAPLINVDGTLYGTTEKGGNLGDCDGVKNLGCGTVYSMSTSGAEQVVFPFPLPCCDRRCVHPCHGDGSSPTGLVDVKGTLYGTAEYGGGHFDEGTFYSVSTSGSATVLYRFPGSSRAREPAAGLVDVKGMLYGTTVEGGHSCSTRYYYYCGTVFAVSTSGTVTVLHDFEGSTGGKTDGASPHASLIVVNGTLYGTTSGGGKLDDGTVYSISTTGTERVLHSFGSGPDGYDPVASLINVKGTLYGTTASGGKSGYGTVFELSP
jgi:uncharacterized repeat protein (TIGR03803 family)